LVDGKEVSFGAQALLCVAGVGTMTLRSNQSDQNAGQLEKLAARRAALLASMAVESLAAARERQIERERKEASLREMRAQLALLAPDGLPKLQQQVAQRSLAQADDLELKGDPAQMRAALDAAQERRRQTKLALRE